MLASLDATAVRRWCAAGVDALRAHQQEIDDLNVYPVPDGDTGTNLVLTFTAAAGALDGLDGASPPGPVLRAAARGALLEARGNSGFIVSQILRGLADGLGDAPAAGGRLLAAALSEAARAAYAAVADPVEGTILSVATAAATGAESAGTDLLAVARAAATAASAALARTPEQLPVLARAGVVDAGGRGLCVLLDTLAAVVNEEPVPAAVLVPVRAPSRTVHEASLFGYEVQYLLEGAEEAVDALRTRLRGLGDSLVIVGTGDRTWNVHVHVNDVGAAIEAGVEAGRPHRIRVTRFADEVPERAPGSTRGVVVVAPGPGLADLFIGEGCVAVGARPSTSEILAAVRATRARQVVVLPNDPNSQAVATAAVGEAHGTLVRVVPTRCPVQALAALAVRDPERPFEDDVIAMAEAAGACRYAEITVASREALTVAGRCRPGDILALVEGEVNLIGADLEQTGRDLLDRMLAAGGELVTLLVGADAPDGLADALTAHVSWAWPFVEVQIFVGGQPHCPLLVGVE